MKQIKKEPQAPRLPLALETVVLTSALAAQEKLIGLEINDDLWPEEKALGKEFSECRLTKVTMAAISAKRMSKIVSSTHFQAFFFFCGV